MGEVCSEGDSLRRERMMNVGKRSWEIKDQSSGEILLQGGLGILGCSTWGWRTKARSHGVKDISFKAGTLSVCLPLSLVSKMAPGIQ